MKQFLQKKKLLLLGGVVLLYALVITPLLVVNVQNRQESRSRAANPTPAVCGSAPSDAMLVIDKSSSMNDKIGSSGTKISNAKIAAKNFVDILANNAQNNVGLSSFGNAGTLDSTLTNNFSSVKTKIDAISTSGGTCIECGIKKANDVFASNTSSKKKAVILLTDGRANHIEGTSGEVSPTIAEQKALLAAKAGNTAKGTLFFTIGLGNDVNTAFLQQMANDTGGKYYFSPTTDQLNDIYAQISQILAKSSIDGSVFNDVNGNGVLDATEPKLSGWTLQLYTGTSQTPQTITTTDTGTFNFGNLCDGTYTLKEVAKPGWRQTLPTSANGYSITISNGAPTSDKNFGNAQSRCSDTLDNDNNGFADTNDSTCHTDGNPKNPNSYDPNKDGEHGGGNTCADSKDNNGNNLIDGADPVCHTDNNPGNPSTYDPNRPEVNPTPTPTPTASPTLTPSPTPTLTPTPTPAKTTFSLTVFQHGIGASGDNTNPESSLSNKEPIHADVATDLLLFNASNQLIGSGTGTIKYSTTSGNYAGIMNIVPNDFPTGKYTLKLKTDRHLRKLVPGILTITAGQNNTVPAVSMVTGDANNDNRLDIIDYNLLLDCYSDLAAAIACDNLNKKVWTDFNDDDSVNQIDYNLFLREISTQPGE